MEENWVKIYRCAAQIKALDPWSRYREQDLFVWQPKDSGKEYFFSFVQESCGNQGIAFYENGNDCFQAQEKLHGKNEKKEPVFLLQNAVVLLWTDRKELPKDCYQLIKNLGLKFRGSGAWPYFRQYYIGFLPQPVPEQSLSLLAEQIESLLAMLQEAESQKIGNLDNNCVVLRSYQPYCRKYTVGVASLTRRRHCLYKEIDMEDSDWLQSLKGKTPRGAIAIDWAFCPGVLKAADQSVIPRLIMAVNTRTGKLLEKTMFTPESLPYEDLLKFLDFVIQRHGKPVSIDICDREMEAYIRNICARAGIRLNIKPRMRNMEILRREVLEEFKL